MQLKINKKLFFCCLAVIVTSVFVIAYTRTLAVQQRTLILYSLSLMQLLLAGAAYQWIRKDFKLSYPHFAWRTQIARIAIALGVLICALLLIYAMTLPSQIGSINLGSLIWLVCYQLVLISLAEELIFRGLVFASFPARSLQAMLVSSILFSVYHWNNGFLSLPYYFAVGMVFAVFRHFHFSLYTLVIGHALFNIAQQTILANVGFRFGSVAFYVVMPLAYICLAALVGWLLNYSQKHAHPLPERVHKESANNNAIW